MNRYSLDIDWSYGHFIDETLDTDGEWVKYEDAMELAVEQAAKTTAKQLLLEAEIAELKSNLHETIELLHGSQADAIQEMYEALMEAHPLEIQSKHSHFITNWIDKLKDK